MLREEPIRKTFVRKLILIAAVSTPLGVLFLMYLHFSASGKLPNFYYREIRTLCTEYRYY